jgi:ribosome biogenesis GTP-binding protein YlqF
MERGTQRRLMAVASAEQRSMEDPRNPSRVGEEQEVPSRSINTPNATVAAALDQSLHVQMVQWYPGHIAKAERQLKEQLKMVDVVLEVRDARIIRSTSHPQVPQWVGTRPRLLVINRADSIMPSERRQWAAWFKEQGQQVFWTDGKLGDGVDKLRTELLLATEALNVKRNRRGLKPRAVRSCVIGFPNIGKSALINRLLQRRVVESAAKPGVTRMLRWVRLGGELDMLDAPGVIPASFNDQVAAQRLAMCNDIGEAAYVDSLVATALVVRCKTLPNNGKILERLAERYKLDPMEGSAEDFLCGMADSLFFGDKEKAGARLLKDYRNGYLGTFALEVPNEQIHPLAAAAQAKQAAQAAAKLMPAAPPASSWGKASA